jgi:hypothetical protein
MLQTDLTVGLTASGLWRVIRVWEHDDPRLAAAMIRNTVLTGAHGISETATP